VIIAWARQVRFRQALAKRFAIGRQIEAAVAVVALLTVLRGIGYEEIEFDRRGYRSPSA
jgi:hypothetical protein